MDSIRLNLCQQEGFLEGLYQLLPSTTGKPGHCHAAINTSARLGRSQNVITAA